MAAVIYDEPRVGGWLKDQRFDLVFIVGLTGLALACGLAVLAEPRLLMPILLADLWLLGYHHVIATYTRLCFDKDSRRRYGFLLVGLPFMVAAGCVAAIEAASGLWIIVSIYFYWQWFHYARQSWGVAQSYRRKSGREVPPASLLDQVMFYALPVAGVIHRSAQDGETFLGMPIRMIPLPGELATAAMALAVLLVAGWIGQILWQYRRGQLPLPYLLYLASHHLIFCVAYIAVSDITVGWLIVNIWHNAQYVLFVWLFNNRRFATGVSAKAPLLSKLSQDGKIAWYLGFCLVLSTAVYLTLANVLPLILVIPIFIVYHIINFHHYVVDAVIWRSAQIKRTLQSD